MQLLMDHDEERRRETEYWAMFQVTLRTPHCAMLHNVIIEVLFVYVGCYVIMFE